MSAIVDRTSTRAFSHVQQMGADEEVVQFTSIQDISRQGVIISTFSILSTLNSQLSTLNVYKHTYTNDQLKSLIVLHGI